MAFRWERRLAFAWEDDWPLRTGAGSLEGALAGTGRWTDPSEPRRRAILRADVPAKAPSREPTPLEGYASFA